MVQCFCRRGKVPKWSKGADSKSVRRRKACVGSTPTLSAIILNNQINLFTLGVEVFFVHISEFISFHNFILICLDKRNRLVKTAKPHTLAYSLIITNICQIINEHKCLL